MQENYSIKPKFKVGDRVKMFSHSFLRKEKQKDSYFDITGLVQSLKYDKTLTISGWHLVNDPNNNHPPYYQYEVIEDYHSYHERWLKVSLKEKLNKLLKI